MAEFMMLMKGSSSAGDWETYVGELQKTGNFKGGSALANGVNAQKGSDSAADGCVVTGFIRIDADSIDDVVALLAGNPVHEAGGEIEILELVEE